MTPTRTRILILAASVGGVLIGCSQPEGTRESPAPVSSDVAAAQELPAGHPPLDEAAAGADMSILEPPAGSGSGASALRWEVPSRWQEVAPDSAMRRAQYRVPGDAGEAECVVYYFGPGQGGDAMANALRWADQFTQPDGSSSRDVLTTQEIEANGVPVLLSEVTGTYSGGMAMMGGPDQELTGYMLLGAVAEGPDANWFFKLTGPEATVAAERAAFRGMIESIAPGG